MTVAELIAELQRLPQDAMVVVDGYEGGLRDVKDASVVNIKLNVNDEWYYGPHEIDGSYDKTDYDKTIEGDTVAIFLQ